MRRLVVACILALAAHGLLFLTKAPWVLPRITPPKWSVQPVLIQLNALAKAPEKLARMSSAPREACYVNKAKPLPAENPVKKHTARIKSRRTVKPKPRKPKKPRRIKKVRRFAMKTAPARHLLRHKEQKKESQILRPKGIAEVVKEADIESRHVSKEATSNLASGTSTLFHKETTWEDIPDDILADAPQAAQASVFHSTGEEEALVEAKPSYKKNSPPPYPLLARKRGYEGTVVLEVLVTREGRVGNIRVFRSSGYKILDKAALKAVRHWIFEPGRRGNTPIEMWVKVPIRFVLK